MKTVRIPQGKTGGFEALSARKPRRVMTSGSIPFSHWNFAKQSMVFCASTLLYLETVIPWNTESQFHRPGQLSHGVMAGISPQGIFSLFRVFSSRTS